MPVGDFSALQKSVETHLDKTKAVKKIILLNTIGFAHFSHPTIESVHGAEFLWIFLFYLSFLWDIYTSEK